MIIADLSAIEGRTYPARRRTQNLVGSASPVQATAFSMGYVTLDPKGGQVPWHNQEQEEVYYVVAGTGEMCLGDDRLRVWRVGPQTPPIATSNVRPSDGRAPNVALRDVWSPT